MNDSAQSDSQTTEAVTEISDPAKLPTRPVVSVVMLAYRHEKYLADAIEGVLLQQTEFPIELIIAEDCSPDCTMAIAQRYQREHPELIRVITSSANVGMMANFARAISFCRGGFVAICEGDDYWNRADKLQHQAEVLIGDPGITLVHTGWDHRITAFGKDRVRAALGCQNTGAVIIDDDAYGKFLRGKTFIMTCTAVLRRRTASACVATLDWQGLLVGDWPLFAYATATGKTAFWDVSTATYRETPGSAMNSGAAAHVARARNAEYMHRELERVAGSRNTPDWSRDGEVAMQLYSVAISAHDIDALHEAVTRLEQAGISIPPLRYKRDEALTRWRCLYHASRLLPQVLEIARRQIRYRPAPVGASGKSVQNRLHELPCP